MPGRAAVDPEKERRSVAAGLAGERVWLVGRFGGMARARLAELVGERGGVVSESDPTLVVLGDESTPDQSENATRCAREAGCELVEESDFLAGLEELVVEDGVSRHYTAAMLAEAVGAPVAAIRRWTRRGLLRPVRRLNRLCYYDFLEARVAGRLAELLEGGRTHAGVELVAERLRAAFPGVERPLAELPLVIEGRAIFLRDGDDLTEPGGQRRFDFADPDEDERGADDPACGVLAMRPPEEAMTVEEARRRAQELRELGLTERAVEAWRVVLSLGPPEAEDHFSLAELLYEVGEPAAARERYYAALELDDSYLEARLNLGCILAEFGDLRMAEAALRGAIESHESYADAHYHLAETLDRLGEPEEAGSHWRRFLEVAPESPWAEVARRRLGVSP